MSKSVVRILIATLLVLPACGTSDRDTGPDDGRLNILFVSCDTMRADHVGAYGYGSTSPHIDRLSRQSVLFRQAFAHRSQTWPSMTSIATSKYPVTHGVRTNGLELAEVHESLPEYLRDEGYRTGGFFGNMSRAAHRGYDDFFSNEGEKRNQYDRDRDLARRAVDWMSEHRDERFFLWVHFMNPHGPYSPPDFARRFQDGPIGQYTGSRPTLEKIALEKIDLTQEELDSIVALYDGDLYASDSCVGSVLAALEELDLEDDTLVVFFSDHGDELYERNHYFMHSCSMYDSVLRVPFLIRAPGDRFPHGAVVDDVVELIDIAPTAAVLAGLDLPDWAQGQSLVPVLEGKPSTRGRAVSEWHPPMSFTAKALEALQGKTKAEKKRFLEEHGLDRDRVPKGTQVDGLGMSFDPDRTPIYVLRTDDFRFIMNHGEETPNDGIFNQNPGSGFAVEREELYEHATDPGETSNRVGDLAGAATQQREFLTEWVKIMEATAGKARIKDDPETMIRLEDLGYIVLPPGDSAKSGESEEPAPVEGSRDG